MGVPVQPQLLPSGLPALELVINHIASQEEMMTRDWDFSENELCFVVNIKLRKNKWINKQLINITIPQETFSQILVVQFSFFVSLKM